MLALDESDWKYRYRKGHDPMKKLIVFDLDGTLADSKALCLCRMDLHY